MNNAERVVAEFEKHAEIETQKAVVGGKIVRPSRQWLLANADKVKSGKVVLGDRPSSAFRRGMDLIREAGAEKRTAATAAKSIRPVADNAAAAADTSSRPVAKKPVATK